MTAVKVIEDSICNGIRITTFQTLSPKFLDAEIEKHRMLSTNSSSDRAIPISKMVEMDYHLPDQFFLNQAGMQGKELLDYESTAELHSDLIELHDDIAALMLKWKHVHKQHINRLMLPFSMQSKVITATEWDNFFKLRTHETAQPEIQELAINMLLEMEESVPVERVWHLPYITEAERAEYPPELLAKVSSARCARVSYNNHDGSNPVIEKDLELYDQLATRPYTDKRGYTFTEDDPIHGSALEHAAKAMKKPTGVSFDSGQTHTDLDNNVWSANFRGWCQFRKMLNF